MDPALDDAAYWQNLAAEQEAGTRDDCVAHFYPRAVQNRRRSEEAGRPVFDEIAYVRIRVPGDRNNVVDRRAHAADRERWAGQWAAFLARRAPREGTPVDQWPYLSVARVAELKAVGLFTVEQIAGAADAVLERMGPDGQALRKRAREHLQPQPETETALRAEIAALRRRAGGGAAQMSLLSICREAAAEIGVAVPSSILGNGEATAVRLLAAARREIFVLSRSAAWSALVREHDFAATPGASVQPGGLPADFDYVIDGTVWDRDAGRRLRGPVAAQAWQALRASRGAAARGGAFRIFGGAFHIHPAPIRPGGRIAYEYASDRIVTARDGGRQTGWLADDDRFVLSEALATMGVKWRFKKAIGTAYDDDLNEYLSMRARLAARDGGRATLRLDHTAGPGPGFVPEGDFPED